MAVWWNRLSSFLFLEPNGLSRESHSYPFSKIAHKTDVTNFCVKRRFILQGKGLIVPRMFHLNHKPESWPFSSLPPSSIYHFCFTQAHNHSPTQQQNLKELTDSPHLRSSPGRDGTLGLKPDHKCVPSELYTVLRSAHLVHTIYYLKFKCLYKIERFHIKIQFSDFT